MAGAAQRACWLRWGNDFRNPAMAQQDSMCWQAWQDNFTVKLYDQASHGADYFLVYVTRQGYDPTTQPLKWSDLQLVARTGRYALSQNYSIPVSTSGFSGRHVVYMIWRASHMDQTYFLCSDVNFR